MNEGNENEEKESTQNINFTEGKRDDDLKQAPRKSSEEEKVEDEIDNF